MTRHNNVMEGKTEITNRKQTMYETMRYSKCSIQRHLWFLPNVS